jgi:site-specific DNA-methyltransferase (adenine-specific)
MELMARYEDNHFDLAIVDPPYGLGIANSEQIGTSKKHKIKDWDNNIPKLSFFNELKRVSKKQIIWGVNYFDGMCLNGGRIIWNKLGKDIGRRKVAPTFSECEIAYYSGANNVKMYSYTYIGNVQGNDYQVLWSNTNRIHPTQKPVALYEWLLMNYATCKTCKNQGGYYEDVAGDGGSQMWQVCDDCDTHERPVRILDTHLGSGSIAIACHNLGYDLTACELDPDYYAAAIKRIEQHKNQTRLF